ncbi:MAG: hypothetical protein RIG26_04685 [Thalassospira sp.]|uniref:hypothetical protein n=1 Tax=Thalassospira sp. TaxID=1912094 RepID=UPI0032EA9AD1
MRAQNNVKIGDMTAFGDRPASKLVGNFFILASIVWVVGLMADNLGLLYALDIDWTDDFPVSLRPETRTIFNCMFSLVLGFWACSKATRSRQSDALFGLIGLALSAVLFYRLSQGIPYRLDPFDHTWVAFSGLVTLFFTLLAWRLFSGWLVFLTALVLAVFILEDLFYGAGEVLESNMVFWLIKSGAWNVFSSVILMSSPVCLLAFRADQVALGYRFRRRSFAWLARACSVPHSVFRFANSNDLFWSKLSIIAIPTMSLTLIGRFEFSNLVVLCVLLFGVIVPLILGRFLGRFADSRYFRKRTTFFVIASLILIPSCLVVAGIEITSFICAVFAVALKSPSKRIVSAGVCLKADGAITRAFSVLYGGMFLILLVFLTFVAVSLISVIWDFGTFDSLRYPWHIVVSILVPIVVVYLAARLRKTFSEASKDAVLVGFATFLYFAVCQVNSPGLSGALSVMAMLGGTVFGVFARTTFEKRKGFVAGVSETAAELNDWAVGCVSVLVPITVIAIISAAVCSVIYYPIY